jgi:hypothetical protein
MISLVVRSNRRRVEGLGGHPEPDNKVIRVNLAPPRRASRAIGERGVAVAAKPTI